jgi:hypothetical protein
MSPRDGQSINLVFAMRRTQRWMETHAMIFELS